MSSIFKRVRKAFAAKQQHPAWWFDPNAQPKASILITSPKKPSPSVEQNVKWWNPNTPVVVGVVSPTLTQGEAVPLGIDIETGASYLQEHDGDISWDTIKASTEDGFDFKFPLASPASPTASSESTPSIYSSSSYDSNSSMAVLTDDTEDNDVFSPIVECQEKADDFLTTSVEGLFATSEGHDGSPTLGQPRPLKRVSTITRLVGRAIHRRWWKSSLPCDEDDEYYDFGRSSSIPRTLYTIMEDMDEE